MAQVAAVARIQFLAAGMAKQKQKQKQTKKTPTPKQTNKKNNQTKTPNISSEWSKLSNLKTLYS